MYLVLALILFSCVVLKVVHLEKYKVLLAVEEAILLILVLVLLLRSIFNLLFE